MASKRTTAKRFAHIVRWREGIPKSPVGRSRVIAEYRKHVPPNARVLLAGDYLGTPSVDGAAATGLWAAERILAERGVASGGPHRQ